MERGNWTTSASGYAAPGDAAANAVVSAWLPDTGSCSDALAAAVSGDASAGASAGAISESTFVCHSSQSASGLSDGSCHTSLSASSLPLCSAWTHTPSTVGENQRGRTITCPTSGT